MKCSDVITIPQISSTCWFNAILMAVFYSQYTNTLLKRKIKQENSKTKSILEEIFNLLTISNQPLPLKKEHLYDILNIITPEYILKTLHNENKELFNLPNELIQNGYFNHQYIYRLFKFLGISNIATFDYSEKTKLLKNSIIDNLKYRHVKTTNRYDVSNDTNYVKNNDINKAFDIVIVYTDIFNEITKRGNVVKNNFELQDKITLGSNVYILDSILLTNFNKAVCI
jgi:hypothetical protein